MVAAKETTFRPPADILWDKEMADEWTSRAILWTDTDPKGRIRTDPREQTTQERPDLFPTSEATQGRGGITASALVLFAVFSSFPSDHASPPLRSLPHCLPIWGSHAHCAGNHERDSTITQWKSPLLTRRVNPTITSRTTSLRVVGRSTTRGSSAVSLAGWELGRKERQFSMFSPRGRDDPRAVATASIAKEPHTAHHGVCRTGERARALIPEALRQHGSHREIEGCRGRRGWISVSYSGDPFPRAGLAFSPKPVAIIATHGATAS
jgi:hypothetical protein